MARSESDENEAEKNTDDEAELDDIESDTISADATEAPQSEVEDSTSTKSKGKRKACSSSDDSGVGENVVDGKKHSSSRGRKASNMTITP